VGRGYFEGRVEGALAETEPESLRLLLNR
jgi:hypothetical protein